MISVLLYLYKLAIQLLVEYNQTTMEQLGDPPPRPAFHFNLILGWLA